jgi:hypothetical protein
VAPASETSARPPHGGHSLAIVFAFMVLFLQEGLTYYVSVQTAALFFLAAVLLHARLAVRFTPMVLAVYMLFSLLLLGTAAMMPDTISQNSPNIVVTTIGVLGYVALILAMTSLRPVRADWLLRFYRRSAAAIVMVIVTLIVVTDLGLVSGMTRQYFIFQNIDLITNYTTFDVLDQDRMTRIARGEQPDIDLFYGEQSFLSLVLFVTLVSHVIASRALGRLRGGDAGPSGGQGIWGVSVPLLLGGVACMVYIQSFSSLFYALILLGFVSVNVLRRAEAIRLTRVNAAALLLGVVAMSLVAIETSPYYWHRLTSFSDSLSAQQRFGILFDFLPQDFLLGLHEQDRIPRAGFQNGLIYAVMMAGIGGICLLAYLLYHVARLAHPLGLAVLSMLAMLAVFSQNGAIFSPNKLVILSFVLVPLMSWGPVDMIFRFDSRNAVRPDSPLFS